MGAIGSQVVRALAAPYTLGAAEVIKAAGGRSQVAKVDPLKGADHLINDPRRQAADAARKQQATLDKAQADLKARQDENDATAAGIQARDDARRRQLALRGGGGARGGSLLTGPSGLGDSPVGGRQTLLGG